MCNMRIQDGESQPYLCLGSKQVSTPTTNTKETLFLPTLHG